MENDEFNTMKHTLLIVAIIISGTIIAAVVFDSFPLIIINVDDERIKTINAFAVDASLGVLTSIIFYYLLVYMGERKRVRIEEHDMLNWMKHNRKLMNAGKMKEFWNYGITEIRNDGFTELRFAGITETGNYGITE